MKKEPVWNPSKEEKRDFAIKMKKVQLYCLTHNIFYGVKFDYYSFDVNGQAYYVSWCAVNPSKKKQDVIYIIAGRTRIIEIHKNLLAGKKLDFRGRVIE